MKFLKVSGHTKNMFIEEKRKTMTLYAAWFKEIFLRQPFLQDRACIGSKIISCLASSSNPRTFRIIFEAVAPLMWLVSRRMADVVCRNALKGTCNLPPQWTPFWRRKRVKRLSATKLMALVSKIANNWRIELHMFKSMKTIVPTVHHVEPSCDVMTTTSKCKTSFHIPYHLSCRVSVYQKKCWSVYFVVSVTTKWFNFRALTHLRGKSGSWPLVMSPTG